jgi:rhodanese-related sulfurtransferase
VGTCSGSSTSHGSRSSKGGVESDRPHPFARLGQEPVATINREQLKTRLEDGEPIKLVMALDRWVFDAKHILGSLHFDDPDDLYSSLQKDDEIVVYCSNVDCLSIVALYRALVERGYGNVRRYSDGLLDWEDAGLPLKEAPTGQLLKSVEMIPNLACEYRLTGPREPIAE